MNILLQTLIAETIGTFALIFSGVLAIVLVKIAGIPSPLFSWTSVVFTYGLAIVVMIAALSAVSGGHFNPAVTLGFVLTRRMEPSMCLLLGIAQLLGASLAGFLIARLFGADTVVDAVAIFFLLLVEFGTEVDPRADHCDFPLAIGLLIALDMMAIGVLTGGDMNQARGLGPVLASGHWNHQPVYWIGPLLGGGGVLALQYCFLMEQTAAE